MKLQRYTITTCPCPVCNGGLSSYGDDEGSWVKASEVEKLEESYKRLNAAYAALQWHNSIGDDGFGGKR